MIRLMRDVRLIPIVLFATISLLALKVSGLVFDGGYTFAERMQAHYKSSVEVATPERTAENPRAGDKANVSDDLKQAWARKMFNFDQAGDITGSAGAAAEDKPSTPALKVTDKPPDPTKVEV
ncbi:MAG TPA: hypothetical protein VEH02_11490, partial [Pseudolabrys sp.]|nr:hypothetical protein [Pseudolabrys sp.]